MRERGRKMEQLWAVTHWTSSSLVVGISGIDLRVIQHARYAPQHTLLEGGAGVVLEERVREREGWNDGDDERIVEIRRGKRHQRVIGVGYA